MAQTILATPIVIALISASITVSETPSTVFLH